MSKFHSLGLFVFAMLAGVFMFHCATVKPIVHTVVDKCVEVARPGTDVAVCATAEDILPYLDLIMSARQSAAKKSLLDGGLD